ncbi:MAG: transcriptional regulator MraZ [Verrucomicrobiota bacterium]|jgi:MraZ protein|nr:transcriptional regulator MraZ [Verrucomicrobiota bacterium]
MNSVDERIEELFVGSFHHSLDPKRRLIIPSSWRPLMGEPPRLFAFPHPERKCLYLYTLSEMNRRLRRLRDAGSVDGQDQQAIRAMTASADALSVDAQGRVRIKDELLAHAEVNSKVVLVGTLTRIELWSEELFDMALPADSSLAETTFYGGY